MTKRYTHHLAILAYFCFFAPFDLASAQSKLVIGIANSDGPPLAVISEGELEGGLTKDLGELIAKALGMSAEFVVVPRKRMESLLVDSGKIDITCNANPKWYKRSEQLHWSQEIYPQVERLISLSSVPDIAHASSLAGKRISTIQGYNYPSLSYLWFNGRATRQDEPRSDLMFKAIQKKLTDVAIVTELEFAYWAKAKADAAKGFKVHPFIVTSTPTMCALSPHSAVTLSNLDQALQRLRQTGQLTALLKEYFQQFYSGP